MSPWKVACILVCASVGGGLLLAVAAEWLAWRARPRRAMDQAAPAPDGAFLADCVWCADLSEDVLDCTCKDPCKNVGWCVTAYEQEGTDAHPF